MKRTFAAAALALLATVAAHAQATLAEGEVTKVDAKQGKMTVRHGPIPTGAGRRRPAPTLILRELDPRFAGSSL